MRLEVATDRVREALVARVLARAWRLQLVRFSDDPFAPVDFRVMRNGVAVALVEMKCRTTADTTFATVYVAERKIATLLQLADAWNVAPVFVAAFGNGVIRSVNVRRILDCIPQAVTRTKPRASGLIGAHDRELARLVPLQRMRVAAHMHVTERAAYHTIGGHS